MSKIWIVVSFSVYHSYIVTYLCEKRNDPQNHCNGKCWLKKELNKAEERDVNRFPSSKTLIPEDNYIYHCNECKMRDNLAPGSFKYGGYIEQILPPGFVADVFHPPRQNQV